MNGSIREVTSSATKLTRRYTEVYVLLIYWKEGQVEFYEQLRKLGKKLESSYAYNVEEYAIQSKEPYRTLNRKLADFLDHGNQGALLIVYYGGHGGIDKDRNHVWLCYDPAVFPDERFNPNVNWNSLQQLFLQDCKAHVLFLLDCCKASASILYTSGTSVVEAITAAGFENVTPLRGIHSFTSNLVATLDDLQKPITAAHLCSKITARLKSYWPREVANEKRVTPHHFSFNEDVDTEVVVIAKMGATFQLRVTESTVSKAFLTENDTCPSEEAALSAQQSLQSSKLLSTPTSPDFNQTSDDASSEFNDTTTNSSLPSSTRSNSPQPTGRVQESRASRTRSRPNLRRPGLRIPADTELETRTQDKSRQYGTYKHIPIKEGEIRIIHLLPGSSNEPIRCAFSAIMLKDDDVNDDFHAVSYHVPSNSAMKTIEIFQPSQQIWGHVPGVRRVGGQGWWWSKGGVFNYQIKHYQTGFEATYEPIQVPELIYAALCRFRDAKLTFPLFLDAICINYKDPKELAGYTQLLPRVFYNACHVCVWLGDDPSRDVDLPSFISRVLDLSNVDNIVKSESQPEEWQAFAELMMRPWFSRRWIIQEVVSGSDVTVYCGNDLAISWEDFCDAVGLFASMIEDIRELFKSSAKFGNNANYLVDIRALSAYTLVEASRNLFRHSSEDGDPRHTADLETLISYFPAQESFLPQDTIYSLLAISSDRPNSPSDPKVPVFEVDYSKSPRLVFKEFVEYCVQRSKSLDIICRHWAPKPNNERTKVDPNFDQHGRAKLTFDAKSKMPSWISDVSGIAFGKRGMNQYGRNNGDSLVGTPDRRHYRASGSTPGMAIFEYSRPEDASTTLVHGNAAATSLLNDLDLSMTVSGFKLGKIKQLGPRSNEGTILQGMAGWIHGDNAAATSLLNDLDVSMTVSGFKLGKIEQLGPRSNEGTILQEWIGMAGWSHGDTSVPAHLWRTLVADRGPDGVSPPPWYHRACAYCLDQTCGADVSIAQLSVQSCPSMAINFLTRVRNVIWNRKFLRTSVEDGEGLYGLAPSKAEIGDTICVLYGCSVPVVLREKKKLTWELIGECFVYGMMDGEALHSEMSNHSQEFELR